MEKTYSFDGRGMNDATNPYRERIATFEQSVAHPGEHGRLWEAAPDMLHALRLAQETINAARGYFPKSIKHADRFALENTSATIGTAIAKALGT